MYGARVMLSLVKTVKRQKQQEREALERFRKTALEGLDDLFRKLEEGTEKTREA